LASAIHRFVRPEAGVAPEGAELSPIGVASVLLLMSIDWQAITEWRSPWLEKNAGISLMSEGSEGELEKQCYSRGLR